MVSMVSYSVLWCLLFSLFFLFFFLQRLRRPWCLWCFKCLLILLLSHFFFTMVSYYVLWLSHCSFFSKVSDHEVLLRLLCLTLSYGVCCHLTDFFLQYLRHL